MRRDLADAVVSAEPRRLRVVLRPEEVSRLLASTTNIKHKAALSLTYATGLRSSEVVSLKLTDIDEKHGVTVFGEGLRGIQMRWMRPTKAEGGLAAGGRWIRTSNTRAR